MPNKRSSSYRAALQTLEQESLDRCTAALVSDLLDETVTSEVCDIAEMTYEVDVEERLRLLERREKAVELLVMARYLQTWRNQHAGLFTLFESVGNMHEIRNKS